MSSDSQTGRWCITVQFKEPWDSIFEREDNTVKLLNIHNTNRTQIACKIYDAGIETLLKEAAETGQMAPIDVAIHDTMVDIRKRRKYFKTFEKIYEEFGHEGFVEWCSAHLTADDDRNIAQRFLAQYSWKPEDLRQSQVEGRWLQEHLADGEPHSTEELHRQAIEDNIVEQDDEKGWTRLRVRAHRMNLTKDAQHGTWQLVKAVPLYPLG